MTLLLCLPAPLRAQSREAPTEQNASQQPTTADEPQAVPMAAVEEDTGNPRLYSAAGVSGFYVMLGTWAYFAWYHNVDGLPDFTVGGDGYFGKGTYAGGADKFGHFWINYFLGRMGTPILERGGWDRLSASLISAGLSWTFFAFIEVKDGFYYQLSPGDMYGNTLGALAAVAMENVPVLDEMFDFRLDYFPSSEYRHRVATDTDVNIAEDYSGQTYLLALHLKSLPLSKPRWMRWSRYVDVVGGFESRNYKPAPRDTARPRQSLFLGVSINLQHALSEAFGSPPRRIPHRIGHTVFEHWSPPYTTLRLGESIRRGPEVAPPQVQMPQQ